MFRSLRGVNYRLWFAGALISNIGAWMQRTAQDWIVLTELTDHDATAVGITMALQFGPALLLGPFAGVLVDRYAGRRVLAITQALQGVLGLALGALVLTGTAQLWMVYAFALALGTVTALDAPARQTFVSELVSTRDLPNAVALNSASFNGARLIGPAVAGVLTAVIGAGWVFLINGVSFIAVLGALWALRVGELHPTEKAPRGKGQLRAGFGYLGSRRDVLAIMVVVALVGAFTMNFPIFTSTMAAEVFGHGASEFGLLSSIVAVGSLTGALLAARRDRARLRTVLGAAAALGGSVALASAMPTFWSYAAALVPVGFFTLTLLTTANTYVQTTTPPSLRGRVMAIYMTILMGATPIGAPLIGLVADWLGPRSAMLVGGTAALLGAAVGLAWLWRGEGWWLGYDPATRWRLTVRSHEPADARDVATSEIDVVEQAATRG
ncbi:MFS transporter [Arenivirga flava]|uniref:MFS transporter n=2 Tax=Arenivirga flava TaxID=1930060 RepID=A0AA37UR19_9MICO|nr:MFS transporter [Arenivirga flava]